MLLEEAIQRVRSLYSGGIQSRSSRLSDRHIYSALCSSRSILLRQQINKKQKPSDWCYQSLPCIELIKVATNECPCLPPTGCEILRTKYKIPRPINSLDKAIIRSVTSFDGSLRFDFTRFDNNKYSIGRKFTSDKPNFFIKDEYGYVTIKKILSGISIIGLFHDFLAAYQFKSLCGDCTECECKDIMTYEIPIDGDTLKPMLDLANDELLVIMKQVKKDQSNNDVDDTAIGSMVHQPKTQSES